MAKQQPVKKQHPVQKPLLKSKPSGNKSASASKNIYDYMEAHFSAKSRFYLLLLTGLSFLFSLMCFDNKISITNDDALYIESGAKYANAFFAKESWYSANAPFYPVVLGLLIKIIGVRLMLLKLFSVVCFSAAIFFIYRAFEKRIPYIILIPGLLLTAVNFHFLIYASLTYTETFSLMIFGICLLYLFRIFEKTDAEAYDFNSSIPLFILAGFLCFLMMITRSVALAAIGVWVLFLVYRKRYKEAAASTVGFLIFYGLYKLAITYIWEVDASQFAMQTQLMFQKDVHNPQLGNEDVAGFITRFWQNCQIYISSRFYYVLGFREELSENNIPLTLSSVGLLLWSTILMHKKKQYALLFTSLFVITLLAVTFISLNVIWGQSRLIMLYLPFILFCLFYLLYYYGQEFKFLQIIYPFVFFILFFVSISATLKIAKEKLPVFIENLSGDPTYGYTPDWQNYIKMSEWCANTFPNETKSIAVRKAPMSFIFSKGKEFYPIYSTPTQDPDTLLIPLRESKVNYLMTCELRANPDMYIEGQIIGTMHRYAYYIQQKYPNAFQFVHQEGDVEEAVLYKINYAYIDSVKALSK